MSKNIMIVAIGPVQEFIATARRSRDLWYGSWMLSELSKSAAKKIRELSPPGELIFPFPSDPLSLEPESQFTVPNKIVAVIEGDPDPVGEAVRETVIVRRSSRSGGSGRGRNVGEAVRETVIVRLAELWSDARSHVKGVIDDVLAKKQIDDLLEFYWVSVPFDESNGGNYAKARDTAEMLLTARKVTRNFKQAEGRSVPKSSLDGARESVIRPEVYPERNDPESVKKEKIENLYKNYHARRGEQLSGVDLLKRLGRLDKTPGFKSTSDMAAIAFISRIKDGKGQEFLDAIAALAPKERDWSDGADEGLVFERRFEDAFPSQKVEDGIRKEFYRLLKEYAGGQEPDPYYALLAADGDNMGRVIDAQTDLKTHQRLSRVLSEFASTVPELVEKSDGVLIYSGGDDVLAYLPLHTVLSFARQIEFAFKEKLQSFKAENGTSPTLSIGIVVTHHLEPLSDALELARKAEKEAKSVPGKNGLAIIVSKRSGADRTIKDRFAALIERLETLVRFSGTDAISAGVAYELQNLDRDLSGTIPPDGLAREALRIIRRKRESGGAKDIQPEIQQAFKDWITPSGNTPGIPLNELALEMIVADMFADKEETKEAV